MSRQKIPRLNQEEIIRLGTRKPSFSTKDKMIDFFKRNPNKWFNKQTVMKVVGAATNGANGVIIDVLEYNGIVDVQRCKCGCKHSIYRWHKQDRRAED